MKNGQNNQEAKQNKKKNPLTTNVQIIKHAQPSKLKQEVRGAVSNSPIDN